MKDLDCIFRPRSVAVIGASTKDGSIGRELLRNIIDYEFNGMVFPINPKAEFIHSIKTYPSIVDVPDQVDLAIVVVPKEHVLEVVEDCGKMGVKGLVVISAGFREVGGEGVKREEQLVQIVRKYGMRLVGPNCMGILSGFPDVRLNATFAPGQPLSGSTAFMSQSGALGIAIFNLTKQLHIGFSCFASVGNKADVSGNDLLHYWAEDENTEVIAMYLESFGAPRVFTELAKKTSKRKPIVVVKSGRTEAGSKAASSHTGAMAAPDVAIGALLRQTGVIRAGTIEEMLDIILAFTKCPIPQGNRVALLTNAGGPAIMATDACVNYGLKIATLSEETRKQLASFLPAEATLTNPVDMIASATEESYRKSLALLLADENVDMVIVAFTPPVMVNPLDIALAITEVKRRYSKPVVSFFMAEEEFFEEFPGMVPDSPPIYHFPEAAAGVCAELYRYHLWQQRPEGEVRTFDVNRGTVQKTFDDCVKQGAGYLEQLDAFKVLEAYGFPVCKALRVATLEDLREAGERVGYPVVLKVAGREIVHKADIGGVTLDISDEKELTWAFLEMKRNLSVRGIDEKNHKFLVQEMSQPGKEIILGMTLDAKFGPLLLIGTGGKYVEVMKDVTFGVTPLTDLDARQMLESIRGYPLLKGVRGEAPVAVEVAIECLQRLAQLVTEFHGIAEIDINPIILTPDSKDCRVVDVRIRLEDCAEENA
ncbi:MAG: acetate--CoA ligase family protein [Candidatus Eiseniibacteriota bacterium]|nr:MAG: acetate--CoA ligase family protein [Candidatus Eisenbacteria bacterium]